jgi:hypothetical protein
MNRRITPEPRIRAGRDRPLWNWLVNGNRRKIAIFGEVETTALGFALCQLRKVTAAVDLRDDDK